MSAKIGRNDPCPCGSGRKYKHCCGKAVAPAEPPADSHERAVERAMAWLGQHHRKALATAIEDEIHDLVLGCCEDDEDAAAEAMQGIDEPLWQQLQLNLTEWLLAEGDIPVRGEWRRTSELLLGPGGPLLLAGQRAWLEQLAQRPLRLYTVTYVAPGSGVTLCDALDPDAPPLAVQERAGSRTMRPGMLVGARVIPWAGVHELSGAIYGFSLLAGHEVLERLRALREHPSPHEEDDVMMVGQTIIGAWLEQYLRPPRLPQLVHAGSGEPLMFVTDHYEVLDADALDAALAAQPDVKGDRQRGWDRLVDGDDGLVRSEATLTPSAEGRRLSALYKTESLAARGRAWFEALAGDAVKFVLREMSDPKGMLAAGAGPRPDADAGLPAGIDPQELAQALAGVIRNSYARWADEPIPALDGRTPRQAIKTPAGLERVKGLLRSYEDGEAQAAARQGRAEISYQFLWDALGISR